MVGSGMDPTDQWNGSSDIIHWPMLWQARVVIPLINSTVGSDIISLTKWGQTRVLIPLTIWRRFGYYPLTNGTLRSGLIPPTTTGLGFIPLIVHIMLELDFVPPTSAGLGCIPLTNVIVGSSLISLTLLRLQVLVQGRITTGEYLVSTSLSRDFFKLRQRGANCRHQIFYFLFYFIFLIIIIYFILSISWFYF